MKGCTIIRPLWC